MRGKIDVSGLTDRGFVRDANEDQFLIAHLSKSMVVAQSSLTLEDRTRLHGVSQGHLLLVADGMGGHSAGKEASSLAVETITRYVLDTMPWFYRLHEEHENDLREELNAALERCQATVRRSSGADPERRRRGTTLTMAYLIWPRVFVVHVGDSRCYRLHASSLEQLTRDHTYAETLVKHGVLTPEEAQSSPLGNVVWNAVGGPSPEITPDITTASLDVGDGLLLCTDGLTKHVDDESIAGVLAKHATAQDACRELVNRANAAGGSDNTTVVVAYFRETDSTLLPDAELAATASRKDAEGPPAADRTRETSRHRKEPAKGP